MVRRSAWLSVFMFVAALCIGVVSAAAQTASGTISGRVIDAGGLTVPGVTVTISSPNLQGVRTAMTSENGDYIFPAVPPGPYTITFELSGFGTIREERNVAASQPVSVDVTIRPASVSEVITVTPESDAFTNTVQAATSIQGEMLQKLPSTRTLIGALNLAPAVHATGPRNNLSISGSMSFENIYLLNGVQITDNIRGTPYNLFIEDAIQETTVTTSGVSAEYGRFTGGVVNAVTKSGGNNFSGSFRSTFTNDNWRTTSPFDEPKTDATVPTYEATLGGPIFRDRTWFFAAGRMFDQETSGQTGYTNLPFQQVIKEQRYEGKLTQNIANGHTARVSYTGISQEETGRAFPSAELVMDTASLYSPKQPQQLWSVNYTGALGNNFFVEAQVSAREFTFENAGGTSRDLINGTVLQDQQTGARWWAPTFCGVCQDEVRANENVILKGNYFWSTPRGSHNIVLGYDTYNDKRTGDNHQSGSDFQVWTTTSFIQDGEVFPLARPDGSTYIIHYPILEASRGTKFRTHSVFLNDSWAMNEHVTFNLGARWDKNNGKDAIGQTVADDSAFSPRLGLVWDPTGTGRTSVNASFAKYVAGLSNPIADSTSPAGTPAIFAYFYEGPTINDGDGPLQDTATALGTVFDWFEANGGLNRAPFFVDVPGTSTQIRESLDSPSANEYAIGLSRQLGRGAARVDVVYRDFNDFYTQRVDPTTGQVTNEVGDVFDLALIENTNDLERQYVGMSLQANYRFGVRTQVGGNYTLSRLWGTINGETIGSGPTTGGINSYAEYFDPAWNLPEGDLSADQRHRLRLWGNVELPFAERLGRLNLGVIQQVQSGTPYGAIGSVPSVDFVPDQGYLTPPDVVNYYFMNRDAFRTEAMYRTDLALNYSYALPGTRRELYAQFQLLNLFNSFQLFNIGTNAINTTVLTSVDDPERFQPFNPFTETPVQGTHWDFGEQFGEATGAAAFTLPRTFQFAVGIRF